MSVIGSFAPGAVGQGQGPTGGQHRLADEDDHTYVDQSMDEGLNRDNEIRRILSRIPTHNNDPARMFRDHDGALFDPADTKADPIKWVKALSALVRTELGAYDHRAGVAWKGLDVYGYGSDSDYQKTVGNVLMAGVVSAWDTLRGRRRKVTILNKIDGLLNPGELLVVLGPPGSGCSTALKALSGERNGIYVDEASELNYRGISDKHMRSIFRGEAIYTAEVDAHFPKLTVGDTLAFAAETRAPRHRPGGITQSKFGEIMSQLVMAIYGIGHTKDTVVGNDFVRGVSGGERKRVTVAEAALSAAPLQCWDNSTRGLDSANAIDFVKSLRMSSDYFGVTSIVAIYQAPQSAYDIFDKVSLLYEGEQIFFGPTTEAKGYFERMGFLCPDQQITPDFLTSLTSPTERQAKPGWEHVVPQTPEAFAAAWRASPEYEDLMLQIGDFNAAHPIDGTRKREFREYRQEIKSKHARPNSPYTLSYAGQVKLNYKRAFLRFKAEPALQFVIISGNIILGLIVSSLYYNLADTTASFSSRGALIFFAILLNAFGSALEIVTLYNQRPITEKHARYAYYHPSTDALACILFDLPWKILSVIAMNLIIYFMSNLRRSPGHFFFFLFVQFLIFQTMSFFFRAVASSSRTLTQALAPSAVVLIGMTTYTGYAIPIDYMRGWSRWINYIDPIAYGYEALMVNEFVGRQSECSQLVPSGPSYEAAVTGGQAICSAIGGEVGQATVSGERYIRLAFQYLHSHKWRNIGILIAFMLAFLLWHLVTTELITAKRSKGEVLVFPRGSVPTELRRPEDEETGRVSKAKSRSEPAGADVIQRQTAVFSWANVVYDIEIKKQKRRILDHVDGWVKPGTLTALMGVSGAGKTTLLDVLATRVTMGVVTGEMLVDGRQRDVSFQRKTGYVQQQDVHLSTSTVREALRFSALLRQPRSVSKEEKYAYVEEVLKLLEMEAYGDAVVGVPGEGLNVEQRKRLTIGVELVAKPELLLFLDEPSSGLDSQTSWNIIKLLRKLTDHGQAILCTIHQPSALLFEQFDKLLFLAKGGRTVYFGEVGRGSRTLIDYFVRNGAKPYTDGENPAEWMLSAIGAARGSTRLDWHQAWRKSEEYRGVQDELERLRAVGKGAQEDRTAVHHAEFAAPFGKQFGVVLVRAFQQYWRTPSYIWSKFLLCTACALFIGFTFFQMDASQQGVQNQLLGVFLIFTIFSQLIQQLMPAFVAARDLYEARERPSKTYSWQAFILCNILVEIPWTLLMGTVMFFSWYYPLGAYRNTFATDSTHLRGAMVWLFLELYLLFASTFGFLVVAGMDDPATASNIGNLLFSLCLTFCGVLVAGPSMPGFWKFMWRCTPFTYIVEGMITAAVADAEITCSATEYVSIALPSGQTCGNYMSQFISTVGGYVLDSSSTDSCSYCAYRSTNEFLGLFGLKYSHAWRDFGIVWVYIVFNVAGAIGFYWFFRVPKKAGAKEASAEKAIETTGSKERPAN